MKKIITTAAILAGVALSSSVFAEGYYAGGSLGYTKHSGPILDDNKQNNFSARTFGGYTYDINEKFSLAPELGLGYYGKSGTTKVWAMDMSGVGTYHITSDFDVFGKAGLAYEKLTGYDKPESLNKNNQFTPLLGVGVGYNITSNLQAQVSYDHYFKRGKDNFALSTVQVGMKYSF
ncbi:porin family protein [Vibrio sp. S4M6]|uniref:outer membrane beta-barrel protein n=1 Tax=Vibrio sinus TaxID=2946865 RepID=UPI00202A1DB1|nr:outer membrane beta-barrel protein [Vibrio sinus]MCL9780997.1 porin family protein [Vibrio sinus]